MILTSKTNGKIKALKKLHDKKYRELEGAFLVEGYHLVAEALNKNLVLEIFETPSSQKYPESTLISEEILSYLSTTITPQKILAKVRKPTFNQKVNKIIALNNLQDPGNVGTIIRLAKAFGFDTVIIENLDPYNEKVIRSSQGAFFDINIIPTKNLEAQLIKLKERDYVVYETLLDQEAIALNDVNFVSDKLVIVVGNEGQGISKQIQNYADYKVYIPIDFESLNVACATAIVLDKIRNKK